MTAIDQTAHYFQKRGLDLSREVESYIKFGYAIFTPDFVLLAREINIDRGINDWITDGTGNCWYVSWACGPDPGISCGLEWYTKQAPMPKEYVAWHRWTDVEKGLLPRLRIYKWDRVMNLSLSNSNLR